jgi:hypothetical protein
VDDGVYTGLQMQQLLSSWGIDYSKNNVAIVVSIAHEDSIENLSRSFPDVPIFFGEHLTRSNCFELLCKRWIDTDQWQHDTSPEDSYAGVVNRHQPFEHGAIPIGFGGVGALTSYCQRVPKPVVSAMFTVRK